MILSERRIRSSTLFEDNVSSSLDAVFARVDRVTFTVPSVPREVLAGLIVRAFSPPSTTVEDTYNMIVNIISNKSLVIFGTTFDVFTALVTVVNVLRSNGKIGKTVCSFHSRSHHVPRAESVPEKKGGELACQCPFFELLFF